MAKEKDVKEKLGLVQVYTGNGKGKTTAALGISFRALGSGLNVAMVQFMKPEQDSGEYIMSKGIDNFTLMPCGLSHLVNPRKITEEDRAAARDALRIAKDMLYSGKYDLFIMDEVNVAMGWGLIDAADVIDMLVKRPENTEVILTGRYAPDEIIGFADLVTEMRMVKHPFDKGIGPRKGVEY